MRVWLIGCEGMLGREVAQALREASIPFDGTDREVDITDPGSVAAFARGKPITCVVNCAAYTAVDRAEDEPLPAHAINVDGVRNVARAAKSLGASLVHISTDYVFDGRKEGAYTEEDDPNPLGVYGKSKLEGERVIRTELNRAYIIRTAWLYGAGGTNFVRTMLRLFEGRGRVSVVNDQWGSPTYAKDLAEAIVEIARLGSGTSYGVYHYTNEGRTNWHAFAVEIYERARARGLVDKPVDIVPIPSGEYPTKAKRPMNSLLSKEKIKRTFGLRVREWEEALDEFLGTLPRDGRGARREDRVV